MFLKYVLGTTDYAFLLYLLFYAGLGIIASLFFHYKNRTVVTNPQKFNLVYWFRDNYKRLILNLILILVALRFTEQITGFHQGGFSAFFIGFFNDKLAEFLQNKGILNKRN